MLEERSPPDRRRLSFPSAKEEEEEQFCGNNSEDFDCDNERESLVNKSVNSNVGWENSFPVSVAFIPATMPSKQTAQAAAEHKQEVKSLNLNFS